MTLISASKDNSKKGAFQCISWPSSPIDCISALDQSLQQTESMKSQYVNSENCVWTLDNRLFCICLVFSYPLQSFNPFWLFVKPFISWSLLCWQSRFPLFINNVLHVFRVQFSHKIDNKSLCNSIDVKVTVFSSFSPSSHLSASGYKLSRFINNKQYLIRMSMLIVENMQCFVDIFPEAQKNPFIQG